MLQSPQNTSAWPLLLLLLHSPYNSSCALRSFTWNGPLLVLQMRSYKMLLLLLPLWYYLCVLQLVHCY